MILPEAEPLVVAMTEFLESIRAREEDEEKPSYRDVKQLRLEVLMKMAELVGWSFRHDKDVMRVKPTI